MGYVSSITMNGREMSQYPAPSPRYSGERVGERGRLRSNAKTRSHALNPSPPPSPRSTGEREYILRAVLAASATLALIPASAHATLYWDTDASAAGNNTTTGANLG